LADDLWEAMVKPARKVRIGNKLWFNNKISCDVIDNTVSGGRVLRFESDAASLNPFIEKVGHSPLPPYIDRESVPSDKTYYQTVYASERGSVAAPTAGIHFSKAVLNKMEKKGVKLAYVTLHIGLGTFRPIMKSHIG
jgi:S-adenosylmethionine:tRNA ribosyltransferase-isomerase